MEAAAALLRCGIEFPSLFQKKKEREREREREGELYIEGERWSKVNAPSHPAQLAVNTAQAGRSFKAVATR